MRVAWFDGRKGAIRIPGERNLGWPSRSIPPPSHPWKGRSRSCFCLIDEAYALLNPRWHSHESLKKLSDSEVLTLALLQQLRGTQSERSFLRDAQRFLAPLFPGVAGMHPSSFHRRVRKLRRFLEPLRREILPELVGEPETLIADSTLLEVLHPRQVARSEGFAGAAWVR
jgi:hypothetical protein